MLENNSTTTYNFGEHPYPCIYKLTFGTDFYIGRTKNLDKRVKQHMTSFVNGTCAIKLANAYRRENGIFNVEILEEIEPSKDMLYISSREKYYIDLLHPTLNGSYASCGPDENDRERIEKYKDSWGAKFLKPIREDLVMGNAAAVKRYHAKLDEFKIRPTKEEGQQIREYAAANGMSVQGLFLTALRYYIARDKKED